jgi:hypothetical protein
MLPKGRVRIDRSNHHTCLSPRIGVANSKGQFAIVGRHAHGASRPVHGDPLARRLVSQAEHPEAFGMDNGLSAERCAPRSRW